MVVPDFGRIIVFKLDHVGDVLLATPVLRALKKAKPDSHLAVVVGSWSQPILQGNPYVDQIFVFDYKPLDRNYQRGFVPLHNPLTLCEIRRHEWDVAINLRDDYGNILMLYIADAKNRVGHSTHTKQPYLLTHTVPYDPVKSETQRHFDLLALLDIPPDGDHLDFFIPEQDKIWADDFIRANISSSNGPIVFLSPGGGWYLNWWPWDRFAQLADHLAVDLGAHIILVGGKQEKILAEKICSAVRHGRPADATGITTWQQLGALLRKGNVLVSNDGGVMHLGATVKLPIVALFGPSPVHKFRPVGNEHTVLFKQFPCSPCPQFQFGQGSVCPNNLCMKAISVDEVLEVTKQKIQPQVSSK